MEERKQEGEIQAALPLCLAICFIFFPSLPSKPPARVNLSAPLGSDESGQVALTPVKVNGSCKDQVAESAI